MYPVPRGQIWFYPVAIDFRKGLQGLVELVALDLEQNPGNGDLYIFRSKRLNQVKMVFWQNDGFWMFQKRLEKKRFQFPKIQNHQMQMNVEQLNWLLSGLRIEEAPKPIKAPECYG